MAYTPPNSFTASTTLTSSALQGNFDALKVYLHEGVVAGDLEAAQFADTRHVQPPTYEPFTGDQHGVTGHQGGQWGGGSLARLTFMTKYLTGNGLVGASPERWLGVPNTSFRVDIRRAAKVLFHWYVEVEAGPDDSPHTAGYNYDLVDRLAYICPYVGNVSLRSNYRVQEFQNNVDYFSPAVPYGASRCYTVSGSYGQRDGTLIFDQPLSTLTVGLCSYSQIDRCAVVNWGIALEAFYL